MENNNGLTMDSDYSYIYTFIQYLKMLIDIIVDTFNKLGGSKKDDAATE